MVNEEDEDIPSVIAERYHRRLSAGEQNRSGTSRSGESNSDSSRAETPQLQLVNRQGRPSGGTPPQVSTPPQQTMMGVHSANSSIANTSKLISQNHGGIPLHPFSSTNTAVTSPLVSDLSPVVSASLYTRSRRETAPPLQRDHNSSGNNSMLDANSVTEFRTSEGGNEPLSPAERREEDRGVRSDDEILADASLLSFKKIISDDSDSQTRKKGKRKKLPTVRVYGESGEDTDSSSKNDRSTSCTGSDIFSETMRVMRNKLKPMEMSKSSVVSVASPRHGVGRNIDAHVYLNTHVINPRYNKIGTGRRGNFKAKVGGTAGGKGMRKSPSTHTLTSNSNLSAHLPTSPREEDLGVSSPTHDTSLLQEILGSPVEFAGRSGVGSPMGFSRSGTMHTLRQDRPGMQDSLIRPAGPSTSEEGASHAYNRTHSNNTGTYGRIPTYGGLSSHYPPRNSRTTDGGGAVERVTRVDSLPAQFPASALQKKQSSPPTNAITDKVDRERRARFVDDKTTTSFHRSLTTGTNFNPSVLKDAALKAEKTVALPEDINTIEEALLTIRLLQEQRQRRAREQESMLYLPKPIGDSAGKRVKMFALFGMLERASRFAEFNALYAGYRRELEPFLHDVSLCLAELGTQPEQDATTAAATGTFIDNLLYLLKNPLENEKIDESFYGDPINAWPAHMLYLICCFYVTATRCGFSQLQESIKESGGGLLAVGKGTLAALAVAMSGTRDELVYYTSLCFRAALHVGVVFKKRREEVAHGLQDSSNPNFALLLVNIPIFTLRQLVEEVNAGRGVVLGTVLQPHSEIEVSRVLSSRSAIVCGHPLDLARLDVVLARYADFNGVKIHKDYIPSPSPENSGYFNRRMVFDLLEYWNSISFFLDPACLKMNFYSPVDGEVWGVDTMSNGNTFRLRVAEALTYRNHDLTYGLQHIHNGDVLVDFSTMSLSIGPLIAWTNKNIKILSLPRNRRERSALSTPASQSARLRRPLHTIQVFAH
ncbi:hypothetical protein AGDE_14458 [Angomonas deanei]|uniref:Starter unit:ACP transacylase in aflatoxin biosynthesis, putative n=1 Tax=Angomonas deanei TaxID=59799 RepID=A0A7G2CV05_9TRYP|nr:hypothetical protein AGDE_14458 [Angomonas deanei]CAD2222764.1 Starter unit:ACP transacylase in aflatoxin biosynthesis, putative [Angomonas deanei]|eukprot:EPY20820.1 hypothetical protein AGDE_14458 [Angomonas deanei]